MDEKSVFQTGGVLRNVATLFVDAGITPIIIHHAGQILKPGEPMKLSDFDDSGLTEYLRQFITSTAGRNIKDGNHELWLRIGGSTGHPRRFLARTHRIDYRSIDSLAGCELNEAAVSIARGE